MKCLKARVDQGGPLLDSSAQYLDRLKREEWVGTVHAVIDVVGKASARVFREPIVQQLLLNLFLEKFALPTRAYYDQDNTHPGHPVLKLRSVQELAQTPEAERRPHS